MTPNARTDHTAHSATPDATQMPAPTRRRLKALFTPEQLEVLTRRSDWRRTWASKACPSARWPRSRG